MTGELTVHVELTTQSRQVFFAPDITARHALTQSFGQLVAKDADQDFQERFALPGEIGNDTEIDLEIKRYGKHMH
nr:hypothetical protein [Haematobacter missouriensis]